MEKLFTVTVIKSYLIALMLVAATTSGHYPIPPPDLLVGFFLLPGLVIGSESNCEKSKGQCGKSVPSG